MRIALVDTNSYGGLLHYSVQLADALAARGNEVTVLVPQGHELSGHEGAARLHPVLTPHVRSHAAAPRNPFLYHLRRVAIASRLTRSLVRTLLEVRRGRFDVVLLHWDLTFGIVAAATRLLQRLPGRPRLAYLLHNVRPFNRWGGDELFLPPRVVGRVGALLQRFDVVLVHGERSRDEYAALYPERPVEVVPHGDERVFGDPPPPTAEERVLFFGDWRKVKGLDVLVEAFDLVSARRPQARLTVAGTPAPNDFDDRALRAWAAARSDRVTLLDHYVPMSEVRPLFATARVVCTPYLTGFQSGVAHLAMTMGRAVVTSDVGDLPAAVGHGDAGREAGVVVPTGDAPALARALEQVLADADLAQRLGAAGVERMRSTSSWEAAAERVEQALAVGGPCGRGLGRPA